MSSCKEAVMRQRRRELDARRSKSRVRLGSSLKRWAQLKDKLSFSLHSQLAQHLLESYVSGGHDKGETLLTSVEALQDLILMVHSHAQMCTLPPVPQSTNVKKTTDCDQSAQATGNRETEEEFGPFLSLKYTCEGGHHFLWTPINRDKDAASGKECDVTSSGTKGRCRRNVKKRTSDFQNQERVTRCKSRQLENMINAEKMIHAWPEITKNEKYSGVTLEHQEGKDSSADFSDLEHGSPVDAGEMAGDDRLRVCSGNQSLDGQEEAAVLNLTIRGNQRSSEPVEAYVIDHSAGILQNSSHGLEKKDAQIGGKRKRKPMSKVILPCEFEGCGKVFSSRQYLNHHVKFLHVQQKTFTCSHPSCSKAFNFKKHLKEHEKLHSNQRDFICEFCARAFRTSSNLIIHRRIHTGEKPLQCEVCGFTCRQKASLNWHMRKHNTESTYQFPCEICGRRFEKRDNLTAHCSKSHT